MMNADRGRTGNLRALIRSGSAGGWRRWGETCRSATLGERESGTWMCASAIFFLTSARLTSIY